jgi:hypothetical protein
MRRLFFFLCLLMVASLTWIIGSAAALTTTEQNEVLLPRADVAPEAVNTGFKASLVAASTCAEDQAWIIEELLYAAIDAGAHSTSANLSPSNRRLELRFFAIATGRVIGKSPSNLGSGLSASTIYL